MRVKLPEERIGETIAGKYRLVRQMARGGFGTVYEAQHTFLGRRFAIKFLHSELCEEREMLTRFQREARAAGALENENIAAVTDFGFAEDGSPYIVMEFLEGEALSQLLAREGSLPPRRAVEIIVQACRGVDAAHALGIVHRDLKPENLFLCRRGDGSPLVKVLDFGIAKLRDSVGSGSTTLTSGTMGTAFYMSPEQARGDKTIDFRADIYALGVILYEALTGKKPHPGHSYNAILYHILTKPPERLEVLDPLLPPSMVEAVHRALSMDPDHRYGAVSDFAMALLDRTEERCMPTSGAGAISDAMPTQRSGSAVRSKGPVWVGVAAVLGASVVASAASLRYRASRSREGPGAPMSEVSRSVMAAADGGIGSDRSPSSTVPESEVTADMTVNTRGHAQAMGPVGAREAALAVDPPASPARTHGQRRERPSQGRPSAAQSAEAARLTFDRTNPYAN